MSVNYSEQLEIYLANVEQKKADPNQDYLSTNYVHESQVYADFLDFQDEWQDRKFTLLRNARQDFVRRFLLLPARTLQCGDHTHVFGKENEGHPDYVEYVDTGELYDEACWVQTILDAVEETSLRDGDGSLITLPNSVTDYIRAITATRLVLEDLPPRNLTFDEYRELWWGQEGRKAAMRLLPTGLTPTADKAVKAIKLRVENSDGTEGLPEVIIDDPEEIENQHGFHTALTTYHAPRQLINHINKVRREGQGRPISSKRTMEKMASCEACRITTIRRRHPQMLVYCPPGNGKTTALNREHITGIDTDWLIRNKSFRNTVGWFWINGFSIITNNIQIVQTSNTKVFGFVNKRRLRRGKLHGSVLTPFEDIEELFRRLGSDGVLFMSEKKYLSHSLLPMMIAANFHHYVVDRVVCGELGKTRYKYPNGRGVLHTIEEFQKQSDTIETQFMKKRSKWRKKRRERGRPPDHSGFLRLDN